MAASMRGKKYSKFDSLIIVGAGGHGKVVADIARHCNYKNIYFLDDDSCHIQVLGFPVLGPTKLIDTYTNNSDFFVAVGNANFRKRITNEILSCGGNVVTLISPDSYVSDYVEIGFGCVVMPGAIINAGCKIGNGCIINTASSIDHDNKIGNYVHVSVGAHTAGTVELANDICLGAGAVVKNNTKICNSCVIGAGAVVVKDIDIPGVYVGVPARRLEDKE